mmetsp:Transcript_20410/g.30662  ORF Transcript_20410/g.30662 Transcript_20410/m.30662 type:complete len:152 (-) Transcript_20410:192-647(-)|eukprot:CAMPEP_0203677208 /NCGR_PEP_ID=MMETSP0090-20130426/27438_1 /ASSEMBLY_ACC=CAM_ASM_001088 /TAXON_ID=426623 /ORGANISM="Chaetoceros affinis, Strain CCMP159" /LENGTH=151 /DNA_ID=CAMNT_0050544031 /DNA_START=350 /DNA_END=805 /DNA_ORIENTATION=-
MEEIDLSLIRKLLFHSKRDGVSPDQRISQGALQAIGELMNQFITETHRRASIEAEFENEMENRNKKTKRPNNGEGDYENDKNNDNDSDKGDYDDSVYASENSRKNKRIKTKRKLSFIEEHNGEERAEDDEGNTIQPKHILKVSAEVLMDFS